MGKSILTPAQYYVLELASKEETITDWFYFTGGTALSEFYLQHRLSEDLDFFSENEFSQEIIDDFIEKIIKDRNITFQKKTILGHGIFTLAFEDKTDLKIDFVHQPFQQLESGKKYHTLRIASIWDIAVDKLYTIFHRQKTRDFVDLYFSMREIDCNLDQLISAMEEKYSAGFDKMSLLSRLPIVKDLIDYPKMLVPFNRKEMENFFLKATKGLEGEILK